MIENPLKQVLVKRASLLGTLRGMSNEERTAYEQRINQRRAEAEQREALIDKYLPVILDPSQPIPEEIKPILQEVIGDREIDDWESWNKGFRGWRYGDNGRLIDAYGKRMSAKYDLLGNLKVPTKELTPSVTAETPSASASASTLLQNPLDNTSINVTDYSKPYSLDDVRALSEANLSVSAPAATPTQNPFTTINIADYNKPYNLDDARAIAAQGVDGKTVAPAVTNATNTTTASSTPTAAPAQQEIPEFAVAAAPQSKSTTVKNPLISIEQARELLAKGIAPTSIGSYHQTLGADGTNAQAQQELELMDKDPTYNPFANTQAKYVQKLNRMRLSDQYNPEVIRVENQRIQQNQAKLDADRRSRMNAARYYAGQGVQGARDYHNYMTRGGQLSQAGQQWRDNFDVAGWNQQQAQVQRQQAQPRQTQWRSVLDGPRDPGEQAYMRSVLGYADTGSGVGSHAAGRAWAAKNNSKNGLSSSVGKPVKNPITQSK